MKSLLVLCFVAYACATPVVKDDCAAGQAHWCTSLKTAKRCGAVQHCIDNVWSQQAPYINDHGDICTFCENVITDVRKLFSNKSEERVEKYMDAACGVIPVPELADQCKDYVKNDIPELFQMIRSQLNAGAICSAIGLCATFKDFTHEPKPFHRVAILKASQDVGVHVYKAATTTKSPAADLCADCEKLVTDMKALLTDKATEAQIETYLKQSVCAELGPVADECTALVEQYVPELMEMIQEQVDSKMICSALAFCPGGNRAILARRRLAKSPLFKAASQLQGSKECDACKVLLSELRDLDRNKVLQADLADFLKEKLCPVLGSLKQECIQTVDSYGQFLFEFLANELDPATRCESLGFCSASNSNSVRFVPLRSSAHRLSVTRHVTPIKNTKPVKNVKQGPQCVLCEFIVDKLDSLLEDNNTEAEIISAIDKVCSILPDTIKEECDSFIKEYGPAILDLLLQELSPQVLCSTIGLCVGSNKQPALHIHPKRVLKTTETCGVCQMVVNYVDSLLEENSTEADIEKALSKVCDVLPGDIKTQCDDFVKTYGPQIIQLLIQLADPKQVCTELGLCPKANLMQAIIKPKPAPLVGVTKCTYGPAYWCTNRATAKECNAITHCEKHVWN